MSGDLPRQHFGNRALDHLAVAVAALTGPDFSFVASCVVLPMHQRAQILSGIWDRLVVAHKRRVASIRP